MSDTDLSTLFQQAVDGYGRPFLKAETAIVAQGETATSFLTTKVSDTTLPPFTRFIAATLLETIQGKGKAFDEAMKAVADMRRQARQTPLGTPMADAVAGTIAGYGDDLSDLIALHLVKDLLWPNWLALAAIIYLGYYAGSSTLPAFDQFKSDVDSGKRGPAGQMLVQAPGGAYQNLEEAMGLVRTVIESETFKEELDKVTQSESDKTAQTEAAKMAVAQAVSALYTQSDNARKIDQAIENIRTALLNPVLQATQGALNPDFVRGILTTYILGDENTSTPTPPDTTDSDTQPESD